MADKVKPTDINIEKMTTPTKEQIAFIMYEVRNYFYENSFLWDWKTIVFIIITEWEKIRNSPK